MLPADHRLHRSRDFSVVVRTGSRARSGSVVVHQVIVVQERGADAHVPGRPSAPRVGLIVSKAVGGSVVRHRVSRRLRAQLAQRVGRLPDFSDTVVRALPAAADATSTGLGADLDRALARLSRDRGAAATGRSR